MSHILISLLSQFVQSVLAGKGSAQAKALTVAEFFSGLFSSTVFKYLQMNYFVCWVWGFSLLVVVAVVVLLDV